MKSDIFKISFVVIFGASVSAVGVNVNLVPAFNPAMKNSKTTPDAATDTTAEKTVQTQEALVDIEGTRYREIQYQGHHFYLKSLEREPAPSDALECITLPEQKQKTFSPRYLYGELQTSRRSLNFMYRLQNDCSTTPDVPHPDNSIHFPSKPAALLNDPQPDGLTQKAHQVSRPEDQEVGISFDSKQHRSKATSSTPGGADGGLD